MKHYTHLAPEERYQIYALMKAGHPQAEIAAHLGRSPATVSRELSRNRGPRETLAHNGSTPREARLSRTTRPRFALPGAQRRYSVILICAFRNHFTQINVI